MALVLLAVVAGWQLRHYSAGSAGASGNYSVDPVIVIAPALALAGGTVLALRLLPAGGAGVLGWPPAACGSPPPWPAGRSAGSRLDRAGRRC